MSSSQKVVIPTLKLSSGYDMPVIAFGTGTAWYVGKNDEAAPLRQELVEVVQKAIAAGYHHIDTAEIYGTEREVGAAIKASGVARSSLFITTKLKGDSVKDVAGAFRECLRRLQLEYVDLLLLHVPFYETLSHKEVWSNMQSLVDAGLVRSIGVSNFRVSDFTQFVDDARIKPAVNQVEFHPYAQNRALREYCQKHNIVTTAYGPLVPLTKPDAASGPVYPIIQSLADKHKVTPAQILMKWSLAKPQHSLATTTSKFERLSEYVSALSVPLTDDELTQIDEAGSKLHFRKFWAGKDFQDK